MEGEGEREREGERRGEGGKMSVPWTSSLSVELLSRVIDINYGCLNFTVYPFGF